jgi:wobble nucleotide-excising tRNase
VPQWPTPKSEALRRRAMNVRMPFSRRYHSFFLPAASKSVIQEIAQSYAEELFQRAESRIDGLETKVKAIETEVKAIETKVVAMQVDIAKVGRLSVNMAGMALIILDCWQILKLLSSKT